MKIGWLRTVVEEVLFTTTSGPKKEPQVAITTSTTSIFFKVHETSTLQSFKKPCPHLLEGGGREGKGLDCKLSTLCCSCNLHLMCIIWTGCQTYKVYLGKGRGMSGKSTFLRLRLCFWRGTGQGIISKLAVKKKP